jgi:hypothetical protein
MLKHTQGLLYDKEVDVEVNKEKPTYSFMSSNESFKNEAQFKYLTTTVTNTSCIHNKSRRQPNLGIARYHELQNHFSVI